MFEQIFVSIHLDESAPLPRYLQIKNQLASLIEQGILPPGAKLPPIRALAERLNVNPVTVVNAYKELEKTGLVNSHVGRGTYVSGTKLSARDRTSSDAGYSQVELGPGHINFITSTPSSSLFPIDDFKAAVVEVLDRDREKVFSYDDSRGFYPLRESLSRYMTGRDLHRSPESIQIVSGAQQGLDIIAKALLSPGDEAVVESPTYPGALAAFRSRGAVIREMPLTSAGPDWETLRKTLKKGRVRFIYVMPDFQNPTGYIYSPAERKELLSIASRYGVYILEEDTFSELDYLPRRYPPVAAYDREERVIFLKSFSKILMPGLRLAFLSVPSALQPKILSAKQTSDIASSGLNQRALDVMIRQDTWAENLRNMVKVFGKRYHIMEQTLKRLLPPAVTFSGYNGGLHFWLELPEGVNAEQIAADCRAEKLLISTDREFFPQGGTGKYLRLSFAAVDAADIERGCAILSDTINRQMGIHGSRTVTPWL